MALLCRWRSRPQHQFRTVKPGLDSGRRDGAAIVIYNDFSCRPMWTTILRPIAYRPTLRNAARLSPVKNDNSRPPSRRGSILQALDIHGRALRGVGQYGAAAAKVVVIIFEGRR